MRGSNSPETIYFVSGNNIFCLLRQYILSLETIYFVSGRSLCLLEFFFVLQKVIFMSPMQPGFYCINCLQSGPFLKQYTGPRRPESTIFIVAKIKKFKSYFEKFVIITSRVLQSINKKIKKIKNKKIRRGAGSAKKKVKKKKLF